MEHLNRNSLIRDRRASTQPSNQPEKISKTASLTTKPLKELSTKTISFKVSESLLNRLDAACEATGRSRSSLIKLAISIQIDKEEMLMEAKGIANQEYNRLHEQFSKAKLDADNSEPSKHSAKE